MRDFLYQSKWFREYFEILEINLLYIYIYTPTKLQVRVLRPGVETLLNENIKHGSLVNVKKRN